MDKDVRKPPIEPKKGKRTIKGTIEPTTKK
jgi:hypothetical protein